MEKFIVIVCFLAAGFCTNSQNKNHNQNKKMVEILDKLALKELVDKFSILADTKEVDKQVLLFTQNATVETIINGKSTGILNGRKQIGDAFTSFLGRFEIVYHLNGQQEVTISGNNAKGISYCLVILIATNNGKKMKTTFGIYYNDEYVKQDDKWLIAKRISNFKWQSVEEINN